MSTAPTILIMAAGTGGHVYPALSIANALKNKSAKVQWLGTPGGLENEILSGSEFELHRIKVSGLRGTGIKRRLMAPFMILRAFLDSVKVLRKINPDCILGMGGFVCGPAGLAGKLLQFPLVIHEQNAVAGLTNKLLAKVSDAVFEAFPNTFPQHKKIIYSGNPLRDDIVRLHGQPVKQRSSDKTANVLVLGGSQGASVINELMPALIDRLGAVSLSICHQTGQQKLDETLNSYHRYGIKISSQIDVRAYIDDMAAAYKNADLVICRSGASTVSELAAAGKPSILIPYPYHKDNQQLLNAKWLSASGAAVVLEQKNLSLESLADSVNKILDDEKTLTAMSASAKKLAVCNAADVIADECLRLANG